MIQAIQTTNSTAPAMLSGLVRSPCPLCSGTRSRPETKIAGYQLEKCCDCGLVFMNPRCTAKHLEDIYTVRDEQALIELYRRIATPNVLDRYREKLRRIERLVPAKGRLLDFACAAGYFFELAQTRGWDAHGCDVGEWAGRAAADRGLKNMHVGRLETLGFPDHHFDVVFAAQVFEHLLHPMEDLAALIRVLKPGGLLYIDVPNYHTLPIMLGKDDFMLNEPPQHINYFTPSTIRRMLRDGGMASVKLTSGGGLKWENLFGRPLCSDITEAYGLVASRSHDGASDRPSLSARLKTTAKEIAKSAVINPMLYQRMKVGNNLTAYAVTPPARR